MFEPISGRDLAVWLSLDFIINVETIVQLQPECPIKKMLTWLDLPACLHLVVLPLALVEHMAKGIGL